MTFHSTHHALQFEKVLKERNINVRLMPVPRQVSSSCGTAGEFPCEQKDFIIKLCEELKIEKDQVHVVEKKQQNHWFAKWVNLSR
jgi:hypothetical protein